MDNESVNTINGIIRYIFLYLFFSRFSNTKNRINKTGTIIPITLVPIVSAIIKDNKNKCFIL